MFAKINHMAMVSPIYPMLANFYEAFFGLKRSGKTSRPLNAVTVGDGYVGLNINPQRDGYVGGLDHFGVVVDDIDTVLERARAKFPQANIVKRPSTRPFANYSGHDPDGNVFDLSQKDEGDKLVGVYAEQAAQGAHQDRYLNKFAIRTVNAEKCADFYQYVLELKPVNTSSGGSGHHLTDGRVTLSILPWSIPIFADMSIKRPGPDHIGFKVDDIDAFKKHVEVTSGMNPYVTPMRLGGSKEADARKAFLAREAGGKFQMADPGGVWIDVTDE
ncbi:MAG: Glyoxalase/Bleomycin resistance protein/Dioxygenase superfamily [Alphaproteobacteria bacterium]|nr:Glyoxalase/Bleomycin resistance protein/Dioxygenase superfamily [Alphaproteobacteria bacterium]